MKITTVYVVKYNGKISQEAYSTLEKAQKFIVSRVNVSVPEDRFGDIGFNYIEDENIQYSIHPVSVRSEK